MIRKRRFWCKPCGKPFTESIQGVLPKRRTTQRFRTQVFWAAKTFSDLKLVRNTYHCSNDFIYKALYEKLELNRRMKLDPWPKSIGIDEHAFGKRKTMGTQRQFVSMIVDHSNKRLKEVVHGKSSGELKFALNDIPGRENVTKVTCDLADPYKSFAREFFPNAEVIADKFHVLRLLHPAINRHRKEITGDRRSLRIRTLLLKNGKTLDYFTRKAIHDWLKSHPALNEVYQWKERLHGLYRIRGYKRACIAYQYMLDDMAHSKLKEIKTLRRTLMRWKNEILNYFRYRITNARTEGYNNVAKVIKRRSYGFRNFENYRLRLLNACC